MPILESILMGASKTESPIPEARVDDLNLSSETDSATWRGRLDTMAERRLAQARARLEAMGIVDRNGQLVSDELPSDMQPGSLASVTLQPN